jgi:hypothetical protein
MHINPLTTFRLETFAARLIMLWLGATAIFFLGLWGPLPQAPEPTRRHSLP